jgi:molybdopterin-guanine dinucleotide biosynthesis protein A
MGQSKAWMPLAGEAMVVRVARLLASVVSPVVVVAAQGQELPELPSGIQIARDQHDSLGPLAGIAAGLARLAGECDAAYVTSCDAPLLSPDFVSKMIESLGDGDIAVPREGDFYHPLAAVYRTSLAPTIEKLIAAGRLRTTQLLRHGRVKEIDVAELRTVDPELHSLWNLNSPDDYQTVLRHLQVDR